MQKGALMTKRKTPTRKVTAKKPTPKKKPVNKGGRPSKLPNIDLEEVGKLAALGLTDDEIAGWLGICRATLSTYKKDNEKFLDAIKKGKLRADMNVVRKLYNKSIDGDTTAMIFWLKNRRKNEWRDRQDVNIQGNLKIRVGFKDDE